MINFFNKLTVISSWLIILFSYNTMHDDANYSYLHI